VYVTLVAGDGLAGALLGDGDLSLKVLGGVSCVHINMRTERTSLLMMSATAAAASARTVATFMLNKRRVCVVSVLCVCTEQLGLKMETVVCTGMWGSAKVRCGLAAS
jgi:hypothetical protein